MKTAKTIRFKAIEKMKENLAELQNKVDTMESFISDKYIHEIEIIARNILNNHSRLDEFVMANGQIFFTVKNENLYQNDPCSHGGFAVIDLDRYAYMKELKDLIDENDYQFHMTGDSMRFTANGEKITNW